MRVCLLHNYRESQQVSMKLYADRLGTALEAEGVAVDRMRPADLLPRRWRSHWILDKVDAYAGRYLYYPRIARRLSADVYHVVDHGQAHLVGALDPRRTVVTCHDLMLLVLARGRFGQRGGAGLALPVFRAETRFLSRAAAVVADSEQTRRDLLQLLHLDPARVEVIAPGLNQPFAPDPAARAEGRRRWGLGDRPAVLQLGNLFYKNVEGCLRVLALLRRRGREATLLRAGGALTPAQRALAERLGVGDLVREVGPLGDGDVPVLFNAADVLLFPSLYEGFGWPPLEAMACGVPVVCSRGGALGDLAARAALTADPEDTEALADHVAAVLGDRALAERLARQGRAYAATFDWQVTARKLADLYRRVDTAAAATTTAATTAATATA
jgi:glycosyltransferase involved in cell wall biosynthesis